jgi:hypothetical protein
VVVVVVAVAKKEPCLCPNYLCPSMYLYGIEQGLDMEKANQDEATKTTVLQQQQQQQEQDQQERERERGGQGQGQGWTGTGMDRDRMTSQHGVSLAFFPVILSYFTKVKPVAGFEKSSSKITIKEYYRNNRVESKSDRPTKKRCEHRTLHTLQCIALCLRCSALHDDP